MLVHLNGKRYNYRHDLVLLNIVKSIKSSEVRRIYADLEGYISPSIISGEDKRPVIIIVERDNVYIFELIIGFETNISTNSERKKNNYSQLLEDLKSRYKKVKFHDVTALERRTWTRIIQIKMVKLRFKLLWHFIIELT